VKISSIYGRNQVIASPHRLIVFNDVEDVIPPLPFPALVVLVRSERQNIGQAAFTAPETT
jgi:hypothetical protein